MIIYFEDGYMRFPYMPTDIRGAYHTVYAAAGYFACVQQLDKILETDDPLCSVYTNSIAALHNKYCWDDIYGCLLYLRDKYGKWCPAADFTHRELRQPHNFMHLYQAGEFGFPDERVTITHYCQNCFETRVPAGRKLCRECEASMMTDDPEVVGGLLSESYKEHICVDYPHDEYYKGN